MVFKTIKIESVVNSNEKTLYGFLVESYDENLGVKSIISYLENKKIEILSNKKTYKTNIQKVDGYRSKTNFTVLNIFITFNDDFKGLIKIGDTINII